MQNIIILIQYLHFKVPLKNQFLLRFLHRILKNTKIKVLGQSILHCIYEIMTVYIPFFEEDLPLFQQTPFYW